MSIVVAYYGTAESDAAVDLAVVQGLQRGLRVVVLIAARNSSGDALALQDDVEDALWQRLADSGIEFEVRRSHAEVGMVEQVLACVDEVGARAVVLGLRSGGSGGAVLGQTVTRLLLDSPVPVVTTRVAGL